jgi:hypothetical protein
MDEKLKNALELSDVMITMNNSKRILKEQYKDRLQYYYNGGRFLVNQELITFVKTLVDLFQDSAVLIDLDGEPIRVDDLALFLNNILMIYTEASNFYLNEFQKITKQRTIKGVLGI